jgi:hypothetical protein
MQGLLVMRRTKAAVCVSSYFANTQNIVFALTVHLLLICIPFFVFVFLEVKRRGVTLTTYPSPPHLALRLKKE